MLKEIKMALLDWFDKKVTKPKPEAISGINLKYVLDTHHALKKKLLNEMDGTSRENLDISELSQDNLCAIGKWLYDEGKNLYGHLPEYETARKVHAELHLCAGEVLTQHQIGNEEYAQELLKTKFRSTSSRNQMEFTRLFSAVKT
jgi:Chemoreceptor zinc-binding domain